MPKRIPILLYIIIVFTLNICASDKTMVIKFGPCWPEDLKHSERTTALNWSFLSGINFEKVVSLGAAFDFLWNKSIKEDQIARHIFKEELLERTLMFPLTAFISISPLPDCIVTPSLSGQAGIGFMHYSKKDVEIVETRPELYDENGWYFGAVYKLALDALINIKPKVGLFGGVDHLWSKPKKMRRSDPHLFTRRNMNGWGLRCGVNLIY